MTWITTRPRAGHGRGRRPPPRPVGNRRNGNRGNGARHDPGRGRACGRAARGRGGARDRVDRDEEAIRIARAASPDTATASRRSIDASPRSERPKPRGRCTGSSSTWECRRCSSTSRRAGSATASKGRSTCGWAREGGRPPPRTSSTSSRSRARRRPLRVRPGAPLAPVASAIVRARGRAPIETTDQLAGIVVSAVGRRPGPPPRASDVPGAPHRGQPGARGARRLPASGGRAPRPRWPRGRALVPLPRGRDREARVPRRRSAPCPHEEAAPAHAGGGSRNRAPAASCARPSDCRRRHETSRRARPSGGLPPRSASCGHPRTPARGASVDPRPPPHPHRRTRRGRPPPTGC